MFQLIARRLPAPLHRAALRVAHAMRIRWWAVRRPLLVGVRVLAVDSHGQILLVRHSYGSRRWMLPGGAVGRGETPIAAAARELAEEAGCTLTRARHIAVTNREWHGANNVVHVIAGHTSDRPQPDGREIVAARWFPPGALPQNISHRLARELPLWLATAGSE